MAINWISDRIVYDVIHIAVIDKFGGAYGIRDVGLLEMALNRPRNTLFYGGLPPDEIELAVIYAVGIIRNHPFIDGNKRVATVLLELFLELNGKKLNMSDVALYDAIMDYSSCVDRMETCSSQGELEKLIRKNCS